MADVTLTYKGSDILELSDSGSATLKTGGKYCEDDIEVEYVKPSGGGGEWTTDGLATNSEPSGDITINVSEIGLNAFINKSGITGLNAPNATRFNNTCFSLCTNLRSVNAPKAEHLGYNSFRNCSFPVIVLPSISLRLDGAVFERNEALRVADFGVSCPKIESSCFLGCTLIESIIIRNQSLVALAAVNAFNLTPFASGGTGGTLYVPQALISEYQNATNWSTILGYANNQILPIEGSQYETHYADGTVIE